LTKRGKKKENGTQKGGGLKEKVGGARPSLNFAFSKRGGRPGVTLVEKEGIRRVTIGVKPGGRRYTGTAWGKRDVPNKTRLSLAKKRES